eukprot:Transcript_13537.p5 GENE.Transcript_13537~~Transcript_13537.p5  ORF type:complete len:113 (+),score=36.84 Transcript_13537:490-828(+)
MTWQLLARVAAAGGAVEPVPLPLFDVHDDHRGGEETAAAAAAAVPTSGAGSGGGAGFVPSVVLAGSRTLATERRGRNASGARAQDSLLDLSAVLLVLQGFAGSSGTVAQRGG